MARTITTWHAARSFVFVLAGLLLAACSPGRPALSEPGDVPPIGTVQVDTPGAVVSPTGVVVPVLGESGNAYIVNTPCGTEAELTWGQPLRDIQVVLDPGHGGSEEGAVAENGLTEAKINLDVARRTAALLDESDISVLLTRNSDYRLPLSSRVGIADKFPEAALISIHHNSSGVAPSDKPGSEVYVQSESPDARRLGGLIYKEVTNALAGFDGVEWIAASDAGVLEVKNEEGEDSYGILRNPPNPSVLAEFAYLSNPSEAEFLATPEYVEAVSVALAFAIQKYVHNPNAKGDGFIEKPRDFNPDGKTGGIQDCQDPELE